MEKYNIDKDIKAICVKASSFPAGVAAAHQKLHGLVSKDRKFFGISHGGEDDSIIYWAAAEEKYEGEAEALGCEAFLICKGDYISTQVNNYMSDVSVIGKTFRELLKYPGIDENGYCLEIYLTDNDMLCLVKLDDNND